MDCFGLANSVVLVYRSVKGRRIGIISFSLFYSLESSEIACQILSAWSRPLVQPQLIHSSGDAKISLLTNTRRDSNKEFQGKAMESKGKSNGR